MTTCHANNNINSHKITWWLKAMLNYFFRNQPSTEAQKGE